MVVGITGMYCSGKNTIAGLFEQLDFKHIDVDTIGHAALSVKKEELLSAFGPAIATQNRDIDRKKLASIVFSNQGELQKLETIVHPWIKAETKRAVEASISHKVVINAAVLDKIGLTPLCDAVIICRTWVPVRLFRGIRRDRQRVCSVVKRIATQYKQGLHNGPNHADSYTIDTTFGTKGACRVIHTITRGV